MKVEFGPGILAKQDFARIAEEASGVLEDAIGPPASRVRARWELEKDARDRPLIRLTIGDWTGEETATFAPNELQNSERARWRFYRLWGDLLQEAADRAVEELRSVVNTPSGE
jgi:hypothetical protein